MGVERLSALSNQERSNLLSAGTKPGGCKFYSRREAGKKMHRVIKYHVLTIETTPRKILILLSQPK